VTEIFVPRTDARGAVEGRMVLNIQAGSAVQLIYFGEPKNPLELPEVHGATEAMSATVKNHLIRSGQLLPDGSVPEAPKALEGATEPPEGATRGEGFLR